MANKNKTTYASSFAKRYRQIIHDPSILFSSIIASVAIIGSTLYIFLMTSALPSQVPLYYSLPWGEQRLTQTTALLIIPGSSALILILNIGIVLFFYKTEPVISRLVALGAGFTALIGVYTLVRIILLIT
ncbi:MAG: hypothetical protein NUV98_06940 [Candidatus Roizmanbacteria bacterium]|nr:hypothetical protein [Candidatus Roizmanbacteria bacterium]